MMLSASQHLIVLMGVIGLLSLIKWKFKSPLTFDLPPLVTLEQAILLSFCGLLLNLVCRAERDLVYHISHDSSKQQHISINTPSNGK